MEAQYKSDDLINDMISFEKNYMSKYFYPLVENPFSNEDINEGIKVLKSKQLTLSIKQKILKMILPRNLIQNIP